MATDTTAERGIVASDALHGEVWSSTGVHCDLEQKWVGSGTAGMFPRTRSPVFARWKTFAWCPTAGVDFSQLGKTHHRWDVSPRVLARFSELNDNRMVSEARGRFSTYSTVGMSPRTPPSIFAS
ncbi:hypothetical protein DFH06DRAFT_1326696 [Mycena polygramma]|nr:hypothetical protein DFH06DRAFT_1326696 [Mycena polygramma]